MNKENVLFAETYYKSNKETFINLGKLYIGALMDSKLDDCALPLSDNKFEVLFSALEKDIKNILPETDEFYFEPSQEMKNECMEYVFKERGKKLKNLNIDDSEFKSELFAAIVNMSLFYDIAQDADLHNPKHSAVFCSHSCVKFCQAINNIVFEKAYMYIGFLNAKQKERRRNKDGGAQKRKQTKKAMIEEMKKQMDSNKTFKEVRLYMQSKPFNLSDRTVLKYKKELEKLKTIPQ